MTTFSSSSSPLQVHKATLFGQGAVVRKIIDLGCDVNGSDKDGNTPLHLAARCGFKGIVAVLKKNGATETKNGGGKLPSDVAMNKEIEQACKAD